MKTFTTPRLRMPAETDAHERLWMAWPAADYMLDGTAAPRDDVLAAWAAVAHAASAFEPVTMVVDPAHEAVARRLLSRDIEQWIAPVDDAWLRDSGPTFVRTPDGIAVVDWVFNAWGGLPWAGTASDATIARRIGEQLDIAVMPSRLVAEGGGIHVDGAGTALVTETVMLDPARNPGWTRDHVDAELARTIGAERVVWLSRGLSRDYGPYGTRGHVDMIATMPAVGTALVHDQRDQRHPDHAVSALLRRELSAAGLDVVDLPAPEVLRDQDGWVDYTYVNHAVVNGGVVACAFDDPADERAAGVLRDAYPGRDVVSIDARAIFALGGGIHCITQQQPAAL
ncbi:agmatine deiminase family protein [Microbacterium sp. 179-I 3D3 NHS]|uniref:agmatine deiminase family protein n=1 Tax=Microbacterium sp. 179-I 3D3 NHS TaxID=3142382 RepID=UPI0039A2CAF4